MLSRFCLCRASRSLLRQVYFFVSYSYLFVFHVKSYKKAFSKSYKKAFSKSYKSQWTLSKIINGFKQKSIDYHLVSNILPEFLENTGINYTKMYQILNDGHPNQNAYRLIAKYVVNKIYNGTPS